MMPLPQPTTLARHRISEALPEELRDENMVIDGKTLTKLQSHLARNYPDKYKDILHKLNEVATEAQGARGGVSPSIRHLRESKVWRDQKEKLQQEIQSIYRNPNLTLRQKQDFVKTRLTELSPILTKEVFDAADAENNPFTWVVKSGMKGKPANVNNLLGSPLQFTDPKGRIIPMPVLNGYARGLRPSEFWAASYGTRKGVVDTKLSVADSGYLAKILVQIAHRSVVTDDDDPEALDDESRGLPVDVSDDDNIGALLARSVGGYKRNTIITAKVLRNLKKQGIERMLVRSPLVGGPQDGSVYARDVGVRETGRLPVRGENPGVTAAQCLGESLSQGSLSAKHNAGIAGQTAGAISGFKAINQLIQSPKESVNWAAHAKMDGMIQRVVRLPQGGSNVYINNESVFVPEGLDIKVRPGDVVEQGDILSSGLPNPRAVVEGKGLGEGRLYFMRTLMDTLKESGVQVNRRNIELISKGLINHIELDAEVDAYIPGDTLPYSMFERFYSPRGDAREHSVPNALGKYLERPILHYTIGTRVTPSVIREIEGFGLSDKVLVHDDPPPFRPVMIRGAAVATRDVDWRASTYGSGIKSRLLEATRRVESSNPMGSSYISGVIGDPNFASKGTSGKIVSPIHSLNEMRQRTTATPNLWDDSDDDD
jgi:hypothetical protein